MKRILIYFVLLGSLFYVNNAFALCSYSDKSILKKITSNVNTSYDYTISEGNRAVFTITISNVLYVYLKDEKGIFHYPDQNNQIILNGYSSGQTYNFTFYGNTSCLGEKISNLYVNTPTYNPYSTDSVCDNAKEYELCQKWVKHGLSREEFVKNVEEYKYERDSVDDEEIEKGFSLIDFIINLFTNIFFDIGLIIFIIIIVIIVKKINNKKYSENLGFNLN